MSRNIYDEKKNINMYYWKLNVYYYNIFIKKEIYSCILVIIGEIEYFKKDISSKYYYNNLWDYYNINKDIYLHTFIFNCIKY